MREAVMLPLLTCRSVVSRAGSWTAIESVDLLTNGAEQGVTNGMTPQLCPAPDVKRGYAARENTLVAWPRFGYED